MGGPNDALCRYQLLFQATSVLAQWAHEQIEHGVRNKNAKRLNNINFFLPHVSVFLATAVWDTVTVECTICHKQRAMLSPNRIPFSDRRTGSWLNGCRPITLNFVDYEGNNNLSSLICTYFGCGFAFTAHHAASVPLP